MPESTSSDGTKHVSLTEGRLGKPPSRLLIEHVNKVELDDECLGIDEYVEMDLAHAVMLTKQGIYSEESGRTIVAALLALADDPRTLLDFDPAVGTLGLQIERYLEDSVGPAGLDIQRARSRIDQKATGWRMVNRRSLLAVLNEQVELGRALLGAAELYRGVLMPGYTHLQHSQPTTVDHYLNAHYWSVSRNIDRAFEAYARLNLSPLGGAAYSGTSWPIDRQLTATYLGFDRPIANARDSGFASIDMGAELAAVLGLVLSGVSRLAADLSYWASSEVGLVRIDASLSGTSSMMPQKRNPMSLERIRGLAGTAVGWSASQLGVMHTATSTDVDQAYVHNLIPGYCYESAGAIALLREIVSTIEIDVDGMRSSAGRHWSTASALADDLAKTRGLSFRAAHEIVAKFIAAHERAGIPDGVIREDLAESPLDSYSREELGKLLDPDSFVATRISAGGTSELSRHTLDVEARDDLRDLASRLAELEDQVEASRSRLFDHARRIRDGLSI